MRGLYKRTHATFESYCRGRWGFSRQTTYNYIHATEVVKNVQSTVQSPPSLQQAAEMYVLTPTQQQSVASRVDFQTTTVSLTFRSAQSFIYLLWHVQTGCGFSGQ